MAVSQLAPTELLDAYRSMLTIRRFEERVLELRRAMIAGSVHLCLGQEAIPVGALAALEGSDRVLATYRGHGWAHRLRRPARCAARLRSASGPRASTAAAAAPPTSSPRVGDARRELDRRRRRADRRRAWPWPLSGGEGGVCRDIGDGAMNQGAVHEALVFAACSRAAAGGRVREQRLVGDDADRPDRPRGRPAERAAGYGIARRHRRRQRPAAVAEAVAEAAARARAGEGPALLEAGRSRLWAHYNADVEHYRPEADRDAAQAADPLAALRRRLTEDGAAEDELADAGARGRGRDRRGGERGARRARAGPRGRARSTCTSPPPPPVTGRSRPRSGS